MWAGRGRNEGVPGAVWWVEQWAEGVDNSRSDLHQYPLPFSPCSLSLSWCRSKLTQSNRGLPQERGHMLHYLEEIFVSPPPFVGYSAHSGGATALVKLDLVRIQLPQP